MISFDLFKTLDNVSDIIKEVVTDKDKANELQSNLEVAKLKVYMAELETKTVPWVDAVHKMMRPTISLLSIVIPSILLYMQPDINPLAIAALVGPGGVYNYIKGKGK